MAMVRWDPFSEMMTVQRDMNRLFSSLGMPLYTSKGNGEQVAWMPTVDIMRRGDDLLIRADLPGVKPEDVDVSVTDDVLTVKGKREGHEETQQGEYIRKESTFGAFERQVMLPQGIRAEDIAAAYHEGILEITVPGAAKSSRPQTRQIPIGGVEGRQQMSPGEQAAMQGQSQQGAAPGEQSQRIPVGGQGTEEGTR